MHFQVIHTYLAAAGLCVLTGCTSTRTAHYTVPGSPVRRASVAQFVQQFAAREGFDRTSLGLPRFIGGYHAIYARYRDRSDAAITLGAFDLVSTVEARLIEERRIRIGPTDRFSRLDAAIQRDFRRTFGAAAQFTTETSTTLW
jgi:hypothetical protein